MNLGPTELIVLVVVMLFVFGPKRIPELGKSMGEALSGFRKAIKDDTEHKVAAAPSEPRALAASSEVQTPSFEPAPVEHAGVVS